MLSILLGPMGLGTTEILIVAVIPALIFFFLGYFAGLAKGRKESNK